jgi:hypothetical protein
MRDEIVLPDDARAQDMAEESKEMMEHLSDYGIRVSLYSVKPYVEGADKEPWIMCLEQPSTGLHNHISGPNPIIAAERAIAAVADWPRCQTFWEKNIPIIECEEHDEGVRGSDKKRAARSATYQIPNDYRWQMYDVMYPN